MMVLFRSSFITGAFVCAIAILGQFATVYAAPQWAMRPKLRVLGAELSSSAMASLIPAATVGVDESASPAVLSPEVSAPSPETTQPPDSQSSDDTNSELAAQTNAAVSPASGFGAALIVGSIAAITQIF